MAIQNKRTIGSGKCYQVSVRDNNGKWFKRKSFNRKVDAEKHERYLLSLRDQGHFSVDLNKKDMSFGEYWRLWSTQCRSEISAGWKGTQDQIFRDYLESELGSLSLSKIKSPQIQTCILKAKEKGRSDQTCLHIYNLLHKIFEDSVEHWEFLDSNPVRRRNKPRLLREERPFLTPQESRKLLAAARTVSSIGSAIWLGILTGMRPGEIQALQWENVDFANKQILIRKNFVRKEGVIKNYPKQRKQARVPMLSELSEFLSLQKRDQLSTDFVVRGERGGMLSYNAFLRGTKNLCKELGITIVTPHELRHSCTELFVEAGANAEDIRRLLNHSSVSVTQTYIHRTDDRLNELAANVLTKPKLSIA